MTDRIKKGAIFALPLLAMMPTQAFAAGGSNGSSALNGVLSGVGGIAITIACIAGIIALIVKAVQFKGGNASAKDFILAFLGIVAIVGAIYLFTQPSIISGLASPVGRGAQVASNAASEVVGG